MNINNILEDIKELKSTKESMFLVSFKHRITSKHPTIIIDAGVSNDMPFFEAIIKIAAFVDFKLPNIGDDREEYTNELCEHIENMTDEEYEWLKL